MLSDDVTKALKAHKNTKVSKKYETYYQLVDQTYVGNEKQQAIISLLKEKNNGIKKRINTNIIIFITDLRKKGSCSKCKREVYRLKLKEHTMDDKVILTEEQKAVIDRVLAKENQFSPFLLHGVTGSGKTEVYMRFIEHVTKQGKEAIVLVPEISLTPQMVERFRNRFGNRIAILHSRLSLGEKYDEWRKIERREVSIVIGLEVLFLRPLRI